MPFGLRLPGKGGGQSVNMLYIGGTKVYSRGMTKTEHTIISPDLCGHREPVIHDCGNAEVCFCGEEGAETCTLPKGHAGRHRWTDNPVPEPPNRGAWGERFEYEGDKFDPSDESLPEGELI